MVTGGLDLNSGDVFVIWVGTPSFHRPVGLFSVDGAATWEIVNIDGYYQRNARQQTTGRRFPELRGLIGRRSLAKDGPREPAFLVRPLV